jgi:hypothetical protein
VIKRSLICALLVLAVFFVFSCASTQGTSEEAPQTTEPEPVEAPPEPLPAPPPPQAPAPEPVQPAPVAAQPKSSIILDGAGNHRVVWGNSLSKIAIRYYGRRNGYYYPLIILGNPDLIKNPDLIIGGMRLKIPDLQRNLNNREARAELKAYMGELATYYAQKRNRTMSNNLRSLANTL